MDGKFFKCGRTGIIDNTSNITSAIKTGCLINPINDQDCHCSQYGLSILCYLNNL